MSSSSNGVIGFGDFFSMGTPVYNVVNIYDGKYKNMRIDKTKVRVLTYYI